MRMLHLEKNWKKNIVKERVGQTDRDRQRHTERKRTCDRENGGKGHKKTITQNEESVYGIWGPIV